MALCLHIKHKANHHRSLLSTMKTHNPNSLSISVFHIGVIGTLQDVHDVSDQTTFNPTVVHRRDSEPQGQLQARSQRRPD